MLNYLQIYNYALIDELRFEPQAGMNAITGETGAGKSIIMGALALVLGKRADLKSLREPSRKCVVEASFQLDNFPLQASFEELDLDYDVETIIRREILPSGKSRSYINDCPVTLPILKSLVSQMVDIHSQHENLLLKDEQFQLDFIDCCAETTDLKKQYQKAYDLQARRLQDLKRREAQRLRNETEVDYIRFQLDQLEALGLQDDDEQSSLEQEQTQLSHAEEIKGALHLSKEALQFDGTGACDLIYESLTQLRKIKGFNPLFEALVERLNGVDIELKDIVGELDGLAEDAVYDPARLTMVNERLDAIYNLQKKHGVSSVKELRALEREFGEQLVSIDTAGEQLGRLREEYEQSLTEANLLAKKLSDQRRGKLAAIESDLVAILTALGMPSAQLHFVMSESNELSPQGCDFVDLRFSANKGSVLKSIVDVASGGEIARVMLSIKSVLGVKKHLPTIIFDEIDTGVSGEIAHKMGEIIKKMSYNMQVICITHLPQIAAKASCHFKVFKQEGENTRTCMKTLNKEERIEEIASILSGENPSQAALLNAQDLLNV